MKHLMPYPRKASSLKRLYRNCKILEKSEIWKVKKVNIDYFIGQIYKKGPITEESSSYDILNAYIVVRGFNQLSEATNKLWSTVELFYHAIDPDNLLCKTFNTGYLVSSTIPTLHYASISAMISILSAFGVISEVQHEERMKFMNIVRTSDGFIVSGRNQYMKDIFGKVVKGWHTQIIQMYEGFSDKGVQLPKLDMKAIRKLHLYRNRFHYDILTKTTMYGVFGEGIYIDHLAPVIEVLEHAINLYIADLELESVNKVEKRFEDLKKNVEVVIKKYEHSRRDEW